MDAHISDSELTLYAQLYCCPSKYFKTETTLITSYRNCITIRNSRIIRTVRKIGTCNTRRNISPSRSIIPIARSHGGKHFCRRMPYADQKRNQPLIPLVLPEWGMAEDESVTDTEGADRE